MGNKGYSPSLPLRAFPVHYKMIDNIGANIRQNLKNLILTIPGERVMMPEFGVGLKQFIFENNKQDIAAEIDGAIRDAVEEYMPFVEIIYIDFPTANNGELIDEENLFIVISYAVPPLNLQDNLIIT
tara:strand:+ start:280 stop:660 length:381 start_codon:yes stop_codon:yes gene_type:complete